MRKFVEVLRVRQLLASVVAISAVLVSRRTFEFPLTEVETFLGIAVVIGAVAIHFRSLAAQVLGHGLLWSNFVLGVFSGVRTSAFPLNSERIPNFGLSVGCGFALLLAERSALARGANARGVRPAAFAGTTELLMVLAVADAQIGVFLGFASRGPGETELLLLVALAFLVGVVGLYRLAPWGAALTMSAAAVMSLLILFGGFHEIEAQLAILFGIQLLVPVPMLVALATKRALPRPSPRLRSAAGSIVIATLLLVCVVVALRRRLSGPMLESTDPDHSPVPQTADR